MLVKLQNAKAIVVARDELRNSLTSLAKHLDSEIDQLAKLLKNGSKPDDLFETLKVLFRLWPIKKTIIENESRKIIAELGMVEE